MKNDTLDNRSRRGFLKKMVLTGAVAIPGMALATDAFGASGKAPQAAVQYQDHPKGQQMCSKCRFFIAPDKKGTKGKCQVVQGAIAPQGWCSLYSAAG